MCGIAGFCGPGDQSDIKAVTRALAHRGPDGEGYHHDLGLRVHLGHRRLAIVDLEHGAQPMWSRDGTIAVVFNGEIYNHLELRQELQSKGCVFLTDHSDTEVLIHGWKCWGRELSRRLNGMFAFAIWDQDRRLFHLSRDRFGEKPLYWTWRDGLFMFASELSAFNRHSSFRREFDQKALAKLLAYGFIPSPKSFYKDCHKLPAGHWLEYRLADARIDAQAYWAFRIQPAHNPPSEDEAAEELQALLTRSVKLRLMSDVPLGIFLSGGIDSSTVAVLAAQHAAIDSFSIGFTEKSYDESECARAVASSIGANHHEEQLTLDLARDLIPEVLGRLDEPISDPSLLPTFLLSKFTRRHVKVALSGDGGDELFAGYDTFAAIRPARLYRAVVPALIHKNVCRLADLLPQSGRNMSLDFKIRRGLAGVWHPAPQWNPRWLAPLQPDQIADLLHVRVDPEEIYSEAIELWNSASSPDPIDRTMEFYTRFYLQDDILAKVDRASMMNSLETRAVFLDVELAEFVSKLPSHYKYRRGTRKYILKRTMQRLLPKAVVSRPKKGFGIPIAGWLKSMPDLQPAKAAQSADLAQLRLWERQHRAGTRDHRLVLWTWHVLQHHDAWQDYRAATPSHPTQQRRVAG